MGFLSISFLAFKVEIIKPTAIGSMYVDSKGILCLVQGLAPSRYSGHAGHQEDCWTRRLILTPTAGQFSSDGLHFPSWPENDLHAVVLRILSALAALVVCKVGRASRELMQSSEGWEPCYRPESHLWCPGLGSCSCPSL